MTIPTFTPRSLPGLAALLIVLPWLTATFTVAQSAASGRPGTPQAEPDRVVATVDPAKSIRLGGHLPAWAQTSRDAGAPSSELRLDHLTVLLARSPKRERDFKQLLDDQQNPSSPEYHHWLTPDQIGERYGLTSHDIAAVTEWLQSRGLKIEQVSRSRTVVSFSGTVGEVEAALAVHFRTFAIPPDEAAQGTPIRRLSIAADPRVPSALAAVIQAFGGLSQVPVHPYGRAEVKPISAKPQFSYCAQSGTCLHFIAPADFATIFNLTGPLFNLAGSGQSIAIIGRSRVDPNDIGGFISATQITDNYPTVLIPPDGAEPGTTNDGDQLEATIDVTRAMGTAQQASEHLIVSANSPTQDGIYIASLYEVDTVLDPVMTVSFGACESDAGAAGVALYDNLASQAAGEGISVFVSSGDAGAAGCDRNNATPPVSQIKSPNYICSSSYVTCVGGTEFNDAANPLQYWSTTNASGDSSALGYIPEGGWNEPSLLNSTGATVYQASASGGGASSAIAKPSWQAGLGVPDDGFRDTPDMSFPASAHDGYFACLAFIGGDCSQGYFAYIYGTSAAAPSMAAIAAVLNQQGQASHGNLNPLLYRLAADSSNGAFHDTTIASSGVINCSLDTPSPCNNSTPSPTGLTGGLAGYELTDGYDLVTGLGSIDAQKFITSALPALLTPLLTVDNSVIQVTTNQTFPLKVTVTGSGPVPTGTVSWFADTQLGMTTTLVDGVAYIPAAQLPLPSTYYVSVNYSGDANYYSNNVMLTAFVAAAPGTLVPLVAIAADPSQATVGQGVVFTATVSGSRATPTGTVQFFYDRGAVLGPPVSLVNGAASSLPQLFFRSAGWKILATYFGDSKYRGANSPDADFTVLPVFAPIFTISAPALTLKPGQTTGNTLPITVTSQNNYSDTITFTCKVVFSGSGTATNPPSCSLASPGTLTLSPTAAVGTLTATIGTLAATGGEGVVALRATPFNPGRRGLPPGDKGDRRRSVDDRSSRGQATRWFGPCLQRLALAGTSLRQSRNWLRREQRHSRCSSSAGKSGNYRRQLYGHDHWFQPNLHCLQHLHPYSELTAVIEQARLRPGN